MQRFDFQVPVIIPLNLLNDYRNLLLSGGLKELPSPFKRTTTFNELKLRYANFCQSKNLAFHDPRPLESVIEPDEPLLQKLNIEIQEKIRIKARENGIITFHLSISFLNSLSPQKIKQIMRKYEVELLKVAKWFISLLKNKIKPTLPSPPSPIYIAIGSFVTFMFIQEKATIRKRKKFVREFSKINGVYRPVFKGGFSFEDEEFTVSGKSFHLFWTQNHIRKKTRYKLIAGIVESISLATGINEFIKNYTLPNHYFLATDQSWEILLNFLNPFVLAGKPIQTTLLPANWRSWIIHCSKVYKLREGFKAVLSHLVSKNLLPLTHITSIYKILLNFVPLSSMPSYRPIGMNMNHLPIKEKFILMLFFVSEKISAIGMCDLPALSIYDTHTLSAIVSWINIVKSQQIHIQKVASDDLLLSEFLAHLKSLMQLRKQNKTKYRHFQSDNSVFDPFSYHSVRMTLESLVNKGILESFPYVGRGRGKDKMKYGLSRNFTGISETTLRLLNQVMPEKVLFNEDEINGILYKALV